MQLACAKILTAIYEQDFLDVSYGYRPERSATEAIGELTFNLQFGRFGHILEAEIQGFSDNLDHEWLLEMLALRIDDRAFLKLIGNWLKAGILDTDGKVIDLGTGTPQGGIISPLMSNILLTPFDREMRRRGFRVTRYADDWVATCKSRQEAKAALAAAERILEQLGVTLHAGKTRIVHVRQGFEFLGYKIKNLSC